MPDRYGRPTIEDGLGVMNTIRGFRQDAVDRETSNLRQEASRRQLAQIDTAKRTTEAAAKLHAVGGDKTKLSDRDLSLYDQSIWFNAQGRANDLRQQDATLKRNAMADNANRLYKTGTDRITQAKMFYDAGKTKEAVGLLGQYYDDNVFDGYESKHTLNPDGTISAAFQDVNDPKSTNKIENQTWDQLYNQAVAHHRDKDAYVDNLYKSEAAATAFNHDALKNPIYVQRGNKQILIYEMMGGQETGFRRTYVTKAGDDATRFKLRKGDRVIDSVTAKNARELGMPQDKWTALKDASRVYADTIIDKFVDEFGTEVPNQDKGRLKKWYEDALMDIGTRRSDLNAVEVRQIVDQQLDTLVAQLAQQREVANATTVTDVRDLGALQRSLPEQTAGQQQVPISQQQQQAQPTQPTPQQRGFQGDLSDTERLGAGARLVGRGAGAVGAPVGTGAMQTDRGIRRGADQLEEAFRGVRGAYRDFPGRRF